MEEASDGEDDDADGRLLGFALASLAAFIAFSLAILAFLLCVCKGFDVFLFLLLPMMLAYLGKSQFFTKNRYFYAGKVIFSGE